MERYEEIYPRVEYLRKFRKLTTGQAENLRVLEDEIERTLFWQRSLSKQFEKRSELAVKYIGVPFEQLLRINLRGGFEIEKDSLRASEAGSPPKERQQPLIESGLPKEKSEESQGAPKGSQPSSSDGNQQNATQINMPTSSEAQSDNPTASRIPGAETHRNKRGRRRKDPVAKMICELRAKRWKFPRISDEVNRKLNETTTAESCRSLWRSRNKGRQGHEEN
jgi:hypothetical protein